MTPQLTPDECDELISATGNADLVSKLEQIRAAQLPEPGLTIDDLPVNEYVQIARPLDDGLDPDVRAAGHGLARVAPVGTKGVVVRSPSPSHEGHVDISLFGPDYIIAVTPDYLRRTAR